MVLQVAFEDFGAAVKRVLGDKVDAYLCQNKDEVVVTAGRSAESTIVVATTDLSEDDARAALSKQGLQTFFGRWTDDLVLADLEGGSGKMYVAGVAFKAVGGAPGIWLDAFPMLPTQVQVLRSMYDELNATGEIANVSFEEFVRLAESNVVVASPTDLKSYVAAKATTEPTTQPPSVGS